MPTFNATEDDATLRVFLREDELAARWQISRRTLQRWRREQYGPAFLVIRGNVRYRSKDVLAFESKAEVRGGRRS